VNRMLSRQLLHETGFTFVCRRLHKMPHNTTICSIGILSGTKDKFGAWHSCVAKAQIFLEERLAH
jgi:hypothetical protein